MSSAASTTTSDDIQQLRVIRGQSVTISCSYSGVYVQLEHELSPRSKPKTLFLRVGAQSPSSFQNSRRSESEIWRLKDSMSYYEEDLESKLTLTKEKTDFNDAGIYTCKDATKQTTDKYKIIIVTLPKLIMNQPSSGKSFKELEGGEIGECIASEAKPEVQIKWIDERDVVYPTQQEVISRNAQSMTTTRSSLSISQLSYDIHHQVYYNKYPTYYRWSSGPKKFTHKPILSRIFNLLI